MSKLPQIRKFLVAVLTVAAVTVQAALTDGTITGDEWGKIGLTALGAAFVYLIRNDHPPTSRVELAERIALPDERPRRPPFNTP